MTSTYFMKCLLFNVFDQPGSQNATYPLPETYYIGLSTTEPDQMGDNIGEPSTGAGYERVKISIVGSYNNATNRPVVVNGNVIEFGECLSDWGEVTHYVIFDAEKGGNMLLYGALDSPRQISVGSIFSIDVGGLRITVENDT